MGLKTSHFDQPSLHRVDLELPLHKDGLGRGCLRSSHLRSRWQPFLLGLTTLAVWLVLLRIRSHKDAYVSHSQYPISYRNPAYLIEAAHGAVAAENKRCSDIGVNALKDGGNAVDAAIAATLCTGVVNMFSWVSYQIVFHLLNIFFPGLASAVEVS